MTSILSWADQRDRALREAKTVLEQGGLIGLPTETVYGLATALDVGAEQRLRDVKGHTTERPFTIAIDSLESARRLPVHFPAGAERLAQKFWPGPLTLVLPHRNQLGQFLGVRVPAGNAAPEILRHFGRPVLLTSLNLAGAPPAINAGQVPPALLKRIGLLIDAGESPLKEPSSVVRFWPLGLRVERTGILSRDILLKHATETFLFVCSGNTCRSPMAAGLFRHLVGQRLGIAADELREHGIVVNSAGLAADAGSGATGEAIAAARAFGADIREHASQWLQEPMLAQATHVFVMTAAHLRELEHRFPAHAPKAELLDRKQRDVSDPIGRGEDDYRRCAAQIHAEVQAWLDECWHQAAS